MLWKQIPGYPGYEASSTGLIKRLDCGFVNYPGDKILLHTKSRQVRVVLKQKTKLVPVAYLILITFVGPPPTTYGKRKGQTLARHLDDNTKNNKLSNLSWGSQKQNVADAYKNGKRVRGVKLSKEHCLKISLAKRGKPSPLSGRPWGEKRRATQARKRLQCA